MIFFYFGFRIVTIIEMNKFVHIQANIFTLNQAVEFSMCQLMYRKQLIGWHDIECRHLLPLFSNAFVPDHQAQELVSFYRPE